MTATLRVVIDQASAQSFSDQAAAGLETARALIRMAPDGCEVAAIVPSGEADLTTLVPGLSGVRVASLARRELLAAWQLGVAPSIGGGFIHSTTLAAPLVRHDRVNDGDQSVVTLWDLRAWEAASEVARTAVTWNRGMLKRAVKHADAIVVPTFAHAARLDEEWSFGDRVRVVAGAAPSGFREPTDADARARDLVLPERYVVTDATTAPSDGLGKALAAVSGQAGDDLAVLIIGVPADQEAAVRELASAAGVPERHLQVRPELDAADRAVVLARSELLISTLTRTAWPWRVVEALALGVPVVALDTPAHREVIADGGVLAEERDLADAVAEVLADTERYGVLSDDRGRAYSWDSSAERIWQLHAEL
jgi:glycosyltransferase involved in cell wall biosynthesis